MLWGKHIGGVDLVRLVVREPLHRAYWPPGMHLWTPRARGHHDADAGRCEPRRLEPKWLRIRYTILEMGTDYRRLQV